MAIANGKRTPGYIRRFESIGLEHLPEVGGKNASLGEMFRELTPEGVRVPDGFAITVDAYRRHIEANGLTASLADVLSHLDRDDIADLRRRAARIREMILDAPLPRDVESQIAAAYDALGRDHDVPADVAVRSSATTEDLPEASFAGQQETFLNVQGRAALLDAVKRCFASLFTDRAIAYRTDKGFDHLRIGLSVGVQRMVRSDLASAGVMFTLDTETGNRNVVLVNAAFGLGETVVQGAVSADEYLVFKPPLMQPDAEARRPIVQKRLGSKELKTVYGGGGGRAVTTVPVSMPDRERFALGDDEIVQLATWACRIERHYSEKRGKPTPMDIEWAKDGRTGELFILQARPETVHSRQEAATLETFEIDPAGKRAARVLATGRAVGERVATGTVRVVKDLHALERLEKGDVLVTGKTDADWEPFMKLAAAVVTDRGSRTCHAAIVSRELGIPAIVGAESATAALRDGQRVTVSCAEGESGHVYEGEVPFQRKVVQLASLERSFTNVMLNLGNPEEALKLAMLPCDGVGLARMEFIIGNAIKVHPMALLEPERLNAEERAEVERMTRGYEHKPYFFVDGLARGVGLIAAAFHPREVIVRFSDFKTNEYAGLVGGRPFEPTEENPMLGFRGASRYYDDRYRRGFALECKAIERVRGEMGLGNLKVMVPFCRTVEEGRRVLAEMAKNGLVRGRDGLEVYVMCEIPSNVILAEAFAEVFDGFSIGSNDLTQLVLGVDRDSTTVARLFDERDPAVTAMIAQVIEVAAKKRRKIGICGQAPSDYPEIVTKLVNLGIDSISLNPDAFVRMARIVSEVERIGRDR